MNDWWWSELRRTNALMLAALKRQFFAMLVRNNMPTTTDPSDPRLTHGTDKEPVPQAEVYLVLSPEERAKGFVRPLRFSYKHVGVSGPQYPLRDLTDEEKQKWEGYVKYEVYPESESPKVGKFWTQAQLDHVGKGCGSTTTMGKDLAETYARDPYFYGATYCVFCGKHLKLDEFVWVEDGQRVGS